MTDAIVTEGLTKSFGDSVAVDHLDWQVPEGSVVGLLGPNGAGKTTTLKMLFGMTHPAEGKGKVLGLDIASQSVELRKQSAFVSEDKFLYDSMTIDHFIRLYSRFFPEWSAKAESEFLQSWKIPKFEKIKNLSKGMRAKLLLAVSLARKPRLLVLDEPTEGFDPESIEEILSLIARWCASGSRTVLIATHRLDEVERICDRVSILNQGKLLLSSDLDDLRTGWKQIVISGDFSASGAEKWEGVHRSKAEAWSTTLTVNRNVDSIIGRLKSFPGISFNVHNMNLREIYLACMNREGGMDYGVLEDLG